MDLEWYFKPATEKQVEYLWKWGIDATLMTRGEAHEIISGRVSSPKTEYRPQSNRRGRLDSGPTDDF